MIVGTVSALLLIFLSPDDPGERPAGTPRRPFPLKNPGLVTIPLSFLVGMVVSLADAGARGGRALRRDPAARVHLGPEADEA